MAIAPAGQGLYLGLIGIIGGCIYLLVGCMRRESWPRLHPLIYKEAHARKVVSISPECKENWVYTSKNCAKSMPSEHSEFQPFWYSFDVLLPVVNLRQQDDWSPRVTHVDGSNWWAGRLVRWWEWFQIAAGWVLSLLFVSAIGGIIKR